jgi:hypothetical protein
MRDALRARSYGHSLPSLALMRGIRSGVVTTPSYRTRACTSPPAGDMVYRYR